jgi:hypothetical protein
MRLQTYSTDLLVSPAQVWGGLATEAQAGAIQLMAHLASNLVFQGVDSTHKESTPCLQDSVTPRSAPSTSTATP